MERQNVIQFDYYNQFHSNSFQYYLLHVNLFLYVIKMEAKINVNAFTS